MIDFEKFIGFKQETVEEQLKKENDKIILITDRFLLNT